MRSISDSGWLHDGVSADEVLDGGRLRGLAVCDSLYRALGGKHNIARFSAEFVDIAVKDERIKASFANASLGRIKHMLAAQICAISGGPVVYKGHSMKQAHEKLGLRNADFNAGVEDLQTAMDHAGVPFYTQNKLLALLAPMQRDIVSK